MPIIEVSKRQILAALDEMIGEDWTTDDLENHIVKMLKLYERYDGVWVTRIKKIVDRIHDRNRMENGE